MFNTIKGTQDILPDEMVKWKYVESVSRKIFEKYGYREIQTPIFEDTGLFTRGVGEMTDVVSKEMYSFKDRGGRDITLRPEGTASVARAYIEDNLGIEGKVSKFYYVGPMFRYERPQAGRYRQHCQIGCEAIGSVNPALDVELINILLNCFEELGLSDLYPQLNSLGCLECRPKYRDILKENLKDKKEKLCEDCKLRYDRNLLRILDCKKEECGKIILDIPEIFNFLCKECLEHFEKTKYFLDEFKIKYVLNKRLVRGFDYYTKTVFEIVCAKLGSQNAIAGGGRYDNLIETLGGHKTAAAGFSIGMERTILALQNYGIKFPSSLKSKIFLACIGEKAFNFGIKLLPQIRKNGILAEIDYNNRSLKSQMRTANDLGVKYAIIIGENELAKNSVFSA